MIADFWRLGNVHGVQVAQLVYRRPDDLLDFVELAHVAKGYGGISTYIPDFLGDLLGALLVGGYVVDADIVAIAG